MLSPKQSVTLITYGRNEMTIFEVLSNPPKKKVQGIKVNAWRVPPLKDRKAMAKAIEKYIKDEWDYTDD